MEMAGMVRNSRRLANMGRRRFVESLVSLGLTSELAQTITQDKLQELTGDPTDEVPRLRGMAPTPEEKLQAREEGRPAEREPVYYTISRDKWIRVETAHDAATSLTRRLSRMDENGQLGAAVTTEEGHRKVIEVQYAELYDGESGELTRSPSVSVGAVRDRIPDSVSGTVGEGSDAVTVEDIPVRFTRVENRLAHSCEHTEDHYNHAYGGDNSSQRIPGGCLIQRYSGSECTSCCEVYDYENEEYVMLTAGHCGQSGDKIFQPNGLQNYYHIGEIGRRELYPGNPNVSRPIDAGTIKMTDHSPGTTPLLADESGGYDEIVLGAAAKSSIKDWEDSNKEITKQGWATGRCTGPLRNYIDFPEGGIEVHVDVTSKPGDSGGPMFVHQQGTNEAIWAIALTRGPEEIHGWTRGPSLYKMEDILNVSV